MGKLANQQKAMENSNKMEPEEIVKAPHSFVINRGKLGKNGTELMHNFRKIMEPYTASQLKVRRQNVTKDFVHVAGMLHVSHLVVFTKTKKAMYMRIVKLPRGPTLTFQIKDYSFSRDVISSQKKSLVFKSLFANHPLLVLNNFGGEELHLKLMSTTFQNLLPSINVNTVNLNKIRRCLLFNYNEDKTIDLRHYAIKIVPTGMSKAVKKLIQNKVPNLSQYNSIDDFLLKSGNLSESEVEIDTPANIVVLPQAISTRGNIKSEKSAIRLCEIGPRMTLKLVKIEEGVMTGEVLFHEYVHRTPEEIKALKQKLKEKKRLKKLRKAQQAENVKRKEKAKQEKQKNENEQKSDSESEKEADLNFYLQEVGAKPEEGILVHKRKKVSSDKSKQKKKVKFTDNGQSVENQQTKSTSAKERAQKFLTSLKTKKDRKAKQKLKGRKKSKVKKNKKEV